MIVYESPAAPSGGLARAYLARLITSSAFLPSGFRRQDGVRGPHIYTGHVVPETPHMPRRARGDSEGPSAQVRHRLKRVASYESAHVSQDRRHGVGMRVGSPVRTLFMASAAARSRSAACCLLIGSQMNMTMLS
jgi:hypothetical protein